MTYTPLTKQQYENAIKSGFTYNQIVEMEKKRKALNTPQTEEPNYFQRVWGEYQEAGKGIVSGIQKSAEQVAEGEVEGGVKGFAKGLGGLARGALRTVGGVAKATFAPITEAPIVKPALDIAGTGISKIPGIETLVQKMSDLAEKHPEIANDIQNVLDVAVLGAGSGAQKPVGSALEKTGTSLEKSGMEAIAASREKFALDLVKPVETKATKLAQVGRTTEVGGIFKKDVVAPTVLEEAAAKEVAKIPGISEKNTFQKNFNLVRDYNVQQAQQLEADIAKYDFAIPRKEIMARLEEATSKLSESPIIVGDAEKTAQKLLDGAKKIIDENAGTGSGLLKARKEYDAWVLKQKPKVFDAKSENAFTLANDTVRRTLNDLLDEKAINLGVKDSLRRQSSLYGAMENIGPKAAEEANTVFGRTMQNVGKILGTKNKIVQGIAAAVGIGGLGAAATFATPAVIVGGTGYFLYRAGRLIMNPELRILLGRLLKTSGHLINPADKRMIQKAIKLYGSD